MYLIIEGFSPIKNHHQKLLSYTKNLLLVILYLLLIEKIGCRQSTDNLLVNGNFDNNITDVNVDIPLQILGWTCKNICEIDNCNFKSVDKVKQSYIFANCTGQVVDLNSNFSNQVVTQIVQLSVGIYQLSFLYYYPYVNANQKTLLVYFNGQLIFSKSPQSFCLFQDFKFSHQVIAVDGNNNITFTMIGPTVGDSVGFKIGNISLKLIINENLNSILETVLNASITKGLVQFPNSRILFQQIMNAFVCLDRLQFYYYHNRNYSQNMLYFFFSVDYLMNQKGEFIQQNLNQVFRPIVKAGQNIFQTSNFKLNYTQSTFLKKDSQGFGFLINNGKVFIYALPISLLYAVLGFLILKWYKGKHIIFLTIISQFTLLGILLKVLCEGNIEQYTFYILAEFKNLFFFNFNNKLENIILLFFFFVVVFTAIGSVFWFKFHYKRRTKLLVEDYRLSLQGISICVIDQGIFCLVFGSIHQMLINFPNPQLIVLFATQLIWLSLRLYFFFQRVYINKTLAILRYIESLLRMALQVFCYLYSNYDELKLTINQQIVPVMAYCFVANWLLQLTVSIVCVLVQISLKLSKVMAQLTKVTCSKKNKGNQVGDKPKTEHLEPNLIKQIEQQQKQKNIWIKFNKFTSKFDFVLKKQGCATVKLKTAKKP